MTTKKVRKNNILRVLVHVNSPIGMAFEKRNSLCRKETQGMAHVASDPPSRLEEEENQRCLKVVFEIENLTRKKKDTTCSHHAADFEVHSFILKRYHSFDLLSRSHAPAREIAASLAQRKMRRRRAAHPWLRKDSKP